MSAVQLYQWEGHGPVPVQEAEVWRHVWRCLNGLHGIEAAMRSLDEPHPGHTADFLAAAGEAVEAARMLHNIAGTTAWVAEGVTS